MIGTAQKGFNETFAIGNLTIESNKPGIPDQKVRQMNAN